MLRAYVRTTDLAGRFVADHRDERAFLSGERRGLFHAAADFNPRRRLAVKPFDQDKVETVEEFFLRDLRMQPIRLKSSHHEEHEAHEVWIILRLDHSL